MQSEVMFAGFGGQGILLSAKVLAQTAMTQGFEVVWIPSYGPEMRGGTAYCMVVISDRPIGSPIIKNPKHLVAMNRPSYDKFAPLVKPGGVILSNSTLVPVSLERDDLDEVRIPVSEIAKDVGNIRAANIVAVSAFTARSGILDLDALRQAVRDEFAKKPQMIDINMAAVDAGIQHAGEAAAPIAP